MWIVGALISLGGSLAIVAVAWGVMKAKISAGNREIAELRKSRERFGERIGECEVRLAVAEHSINGGRIRTRTRGGGVPLPPPPEDDESR